MVQYEQQIDGVATPRLAACIDPRELPTGKRIAHQFERPGKERSSIQAVEHA